jgi:hypothetical protein
MLKQPEKNTTPPLGVPERDERGAADSRRRWKSPQVILGALEESESGSAAGADNTAHS